jgi:hypothetical protein
LIQEKTPMTVAQIIEALPLQVYVRRGELIIHFSSPSDLVNRVAETSAALADLDISRTEGKPDRVGRRGTSRSFAVGAGRSEGESGGDPDQPAVG